MSKLTRIEVLPAERPLTASFSRQVKVLVKEGRELAEGYASLTERMLKFGQRFRAAWDEARRLDGSPNGSHQRYLRDELAKAVRTTNKTVWSQWVAIGGEAKALLRHTEALPPQRDSLYEIALAVREKRPVENWIRKGNLSAESTVAQVRSLRKGLRRQKRQRSYLATVTLCFQDYTTAAGVLEAVVESDGDFRVKSRQAFVDAIKALLGAERYAGCRRRFNDATTTATDESVSS